MAKHRGQRHATNQNGVQDVRALSAGEREAPAQGHGPSNSSSRAMRVVHSLAKPAVQWASAVLSNHKNGTCSRENTIWSEVFPDRNSVVKGIPGKHYGKRHATNTGQLSSISSRTVQIMFFEQKTKWLKWSKMVKTMVRT